MQKEHLMATECKCYFTKVIWIHFSRSVEAFALFPHSFALYVNNSYAFVLFALLIKRKLLVSDFMLVVSRCFNIICEECFIVLVSVVCMGPSLRSFAVLCRNTKAGWLFNYVNKPHADNNTLRVRQPGSARVCAAAHAGHRQAQGWDFGLNIQNGGRRSSESRWEFGTR